MAEDIQPDPYTPPKFNDENQRAVHMGLVKLVRDKLGEDMSDLKDSDVLQAAHLAYAPDMDPQEFVTGAKLVMAEKLHGAVQTEADKRATEAGQETTSALRLKNVHVGPTPIQGVDISGAPGVEQRRAVLKTAGSVAGALGKGLVESLSTPITGLMQWVAAHGLTQEEIAPGVYETRFAGPAEQDRLEHEAVRRIAREAIDTIGWGVGGGEMTGAVHLPGFTNTFARMGSEGAGWGATYEGVDASLSGESADKVAKRTAVGAVVGAGLTLGMGGAFAGLGRLVGKAMGEEAAQRIARDVPVSDFPSTGLTPGERIALSYQQTQKLPDTVQPFVDMAQRGDLPPTEAAIHILGNMGVVNDPTGTAAMAKLLEPKSLAVIPASTRDMALTIPEMTAKRLEAASQQAAFTAKVRQMAIESGQKVEEIRARSLAEKWADPAARANLANAIPEPIVLPSGGEPIVMGPGAAYDPGQIDALREAQSFMPHVTMVQVPRDAIGKIAASTYKLGEPVFDEVGRQHEVIGYTDKGKLVTRVQLPTGEWKYGVAGASDVSPTQCGFIAAINRIEAGASARLARIERESASTLHMGLQALAGAPEWIEIGMGKFARAAYMAAKHGLDREQTYLTWANDMADEMRASGAEGKLVFLPEIYDHLEKSYGDAMARIVLRDSSMREGIYDAAARMKAGGWVGHDWYDKTFPSLVEMFGSPEDAARFADMLAITSANRNIDSNVNLALQAFAMFQTGQVPTGFGPNMDAMMARYAAEEGRTGAQPAIKTFAGGAPKVSEFVKNVLGADVNGVTLDVWMNRYLTGNETMGVKEREMAKSIIRDIAAKENLTPRQVQAAMWADARIAEQILGPLGRGEKLAMTMGSMRPYEDVTKNFLNKRKGFTTEASIIKQTRENGGGTFYAGTSQPYDQPGFSVALGGEALDAEKAMPNAVRNVTERYLPSLQKIADDAGAKLRFVTGTWVENGKMHVEIGVVLPDRERALHLGIIAKQQSVGQHGEGGAFVGIVPTGEEQPSNLSLTEAKTALKEWLGEKQVDVGDLEARTSSDWTGETSGVLPEARRKQGNDDLRTLASTYSESRGMAPPEIPAAHPPLDEGLGKRVANEYEKLKSTPNDPTVKRAYKAFVQETRAQYEALKKAGYKVKKFTGEDPYGTKAATMREAVRSKKVLLVLGDHLEHPILTPEENFIFRAVHDYFGHAKEGYDFGPKGENAAFLMHAQMYSPEALPAMATETRGQNSWVNFFGDNSARSAKERPYAKQKAALLPEWAYADVRKEK